MDAPEEPGGRQIAKADGTRPGRSRGRDDGESGGDGRAPFALDASTASGRHARSVPAGEMLAFLVETEDPEPWKRKWLRFSLDDGAPSGARINPQGVFLWTPTQAERGKHRITILVGNTNAPEAEDVADASFEVAVTDPLPERQREISFNLGRGHEGNDVSLELVLVRPGSFTMGDPLAPPAAVDEQPVHEVVISRPFYLGKFVVTQEQWQAVMGDDNNPSRFKGPRNPVETVNWDDCQAFLSKLNRDLDTSGKRKFRLPTEAQWEYACRGDRTTHWDFGDDESELGDYAWYLGNNPGREPHPVGLKKPNLFGLYDMYGNVMEWCEDWYALDYYRKSSPLDPAGPSELSISPVKSRVLRGGCGALDANGCRASKRFDGLPTNRRDCAGFRVLYDPGN